MEVYITDVEIEYIDVVTIIKSFTDYGKRKDVTNVTVSYDATINKNELQGKITIPFETYKEMDHDELTNYIENTLR
ncbi:hypothetical protein [Bacillus cereus]|uniref:hypothetical protein n=1 Tax=Bacillus cereus TaxID=1396 RepID=UPI001C8B4A91|nr:hypothetical protein [Bacillus cereus]MBX9160031.1 hypothetical protein [Bacillus cereus]